MKTKNDIPEYLKNVDERESRHSDFIKRESKNENS